MKTAELFAWDIIGYQHEERARLIERRDREVRAAALRFAADELRECASDDGLGVSLPYVCVTLEIWADRAERGE